jgi:hypothetical protein
MLNVNLDQINEKSLQDLITNKVIENRRIEYKSKLSLTKDSNKKEFLADISSFGNSIGGDLIIGISSDKKTGEPREITPLQIDDIDSEILKIDSLIRDGINPRIPNIKIQPVRIEDNGVVIIIRIPNSWLKPHRIIFQGDHKFYSRGTNGKYPMDVPELKSAFNLTKTITEQIKTFRVDRINTIISNNAYIPLNEGAKIVLHIIPFAAFDMIEENVIDGIKDYWAQMKPMGSGSWDHVYNLDGYMAFDFYGNYTQVFKNGLIEALNSTLLEVDMNGKKSVPSVAFEKLIMQSYANYIQILKSINPTGPIVIGITLTNIAEYTLATGRHFNRTGGKFSHRKDILFLPESVMMDWSESDNKIFKPIFDSLWNAYGYEKSPNFDTDGHWMLSN